MFGSNSFFEVIQREGLKPLTYMVNGKSIQIALPREPADAKDLFELATTVQNGNKWEGKEAKVSVPKEMTEAQFTIYKLRIAEQMFSDAAEMGHPDGKASADAIRAKITQLETAPTLPLKHPIAIKVEPSKQPSPEPEIPKPGKCLIAKGKARNPGSFLFHSSSLDFANFAKNSSPTLKGPQTR